MKILILAATAALALASPAFAHADVMHSNCPTERSFSAGDITVTDPFSRATLPGAKSAGGYMSISNSGSAADRLVGVSTRTAEQTGVHEMKMEGDVMKMTELSDGLEIPAGGSVSLEPGGSHIMMVGLVQPLRPKACVKLTLMFEKAGELPVLLMVGAPDADAAPGAMHEHQMHMEQMGHPAPAN